MNGRTVLALVIAFSVAILPVAGGALGVAGVAGVLWLLVIIFLLLGIAAFIKYLRS